MSRTKDKARKARATAATAMDVDPSPATSKPTNNNTDNDGWTMQAVPTSTSDATVNQTAADLTSQILHSKHAPGGISKDSATGRKKRGKGGKGQNARAAAGRERAEAVAEQLAQKVDGSKGRARKVKDRRRDWEEVNRIREKHAHLAPPPNETHEEKMVRKAKRKERKREAATLRRLAREREEGGEQKGDRAAMPVEESFVDASFVTAPESGQDIEEAL